MPKGKYSFKKKRGIKIPQWIYHKPVTSQTYTNTHTHKADRDDFLSAHVWFDMESSNKKVHCLKTNRPVSENDLMVMLYWLSVFSEVSFTSFCWKLIFFSRWICFMRSKLIICHENHSLATDLFRKFDSTDISH